MGWSVTACAGLDVRGRFVPGCRRAVLVEETADDDFFELRARLQVDLAEATAAAAGFLEVRRRLRDMVMGGSSVKEREWSGS